MQETSQRRNSAASVSGSRAAMAAVAFAGQHLSISHFAGHSYSPFGIEDFK